MAGGKSTRLFSIAISLLMTLSSLVSASALQEDEIVVEQVRNLSVSSTGEQLVINCSFEGVEPVIPESANNMARISKDRKLSLTLPLNFEPLLSFTEKNMTITWRSEKAEAGDSLFDSKEPPVYPLGPGDKLFVEVYGVEGLSKELTVDPEGNITVPLLDKIKIQGKTLNELQRTLEERFAEYINDPQVNVQLLEYGSRFVNIIGEVVHPIRIPIKRALRLLDAISESGGFSEKSGDIEIQRRDSAGILRKKVIPRESLLSAGAGNENIFIFDQDTINVLIINSVYISGEVKDPQSIFYTQDLTLLRAIAKSGGFTQWAKKDKVVILRKNANGQTATIKVDAKEVEKGKIEDPPLFPNDHIIVYERKLF